MSGLDEKEAEENRTASQGLLPSPSVSWAPPHGAQPLAPWCGCDEEAGGQEKLGWEGRDHFPREAAFKLDNICQICDANLCWK